MKDRNPYVSRVPWFHETPLTSKSAQYLIINYITFFISFYSYGMVEMLYPNKPTDGQIVGLDIFRFLGQHTNSMSRDFKSRVKSALKTGNAVSLELNILTRRLMGYERFVLHWTPLKDEKGTVVFIVLTMGAVQ